MTRKSHLDGYAGGILVSPGGTRVAYFLDKEVLEIHRDLRAVLIARMRIGAGRAAVVRGRVTPFTSSAP
jgi:hypothetical protein